MPRPDYLSGTDACDKQKTDLPWIEEFFKLLEEAPEKMRSKYLFAEYLAYVRQRCGGNRGALVNADHEMAFCKQLKEYCKGKGFRMETKKSLPQGYWVKPNRVKRVTKQEVAAAAAFDIFQVLETWTSEDEKEHHVGYLKILYVHESCGFSAYSRVPIPAFAIICEYLGERITIAEGKRRQEIYRDMDKTSTMLDVIVYGEEKISIDGHAIDFEKGEFFPKFANPAAYLNSRVEDVNIRIKVIDGKAMLMAAHDIPANQELFWDYKCPQGPDQPKFYTEPSKYIPKPVKNGDLKSLLS